MTPRAHTPKRNRRRQQACREVAALYPAIQFEEMIVDNTCMQLVSNPHHFDVMARSWAPPFSWAAPRTLCAPRPPRRPSSPAPARAAPHRPALRAADAPSLPPPNEKHTQPVH